MIIVEDYEAIRRAYFIEKKSIRQIAREQHHSHTTIRKAIDKVQPQPYQLARPTQITSSFAFHADRLQPRKEASHRKENMLCHNSCYHHMKASLSG